MKKIIIFARVKNEDDIIESFCRYNLTYCDCMLIMDDGSDDNTIEIIQSLINEGLPIKLIQLQDRAIYDIEKFNVNMVNIALNEYGADLIIPLDADEFLYHTDGINPRETLEALKEDIEYQIPWRTYVYEKEPDIKLGFMPNNFTFYRNPELEKVQGHAGTTFISKCLANKKFARLCGGSHWLNYPEDNIGSVKIENPEKLVCAHFPVRRKMQIIKKVIPFWISKWGMNDRVPRDMLDTHQLGLFFNEIREKGDISLEKMKQYSIEYSLRNAVNKLTKGELEKIEINLGNELIINSQINISFCKDKLKLRYTNYNENNIIFMKSMLKETDNTIMFLNNESGERAVEINKTIKYGNLYFDTGNGFNNNECHDFSFKGNEVEIDIKIPDNTISVRFDPVEGYGCVVSNLEILSYDGIIKYKQINGFNDYAGNTIFTNTDPQFLLIGAAHWLKIKYRILISSDYSHYKVIENYININKENINLEKERDSLINTRDNLINERDGLINTRDNLINERNNLINEKDGFLNSRSWRVTKPLRDLTNFIRKHKILYLFAKVIISLKRVGIIGTLKKIKKHNKKIKNDLETYSNITKQEKELQTKKVFSKNVKISIITPLYNTPKKFLIEMINSVIAQTYNNWELCLADGSNNDHKFVMHICKKYIRKDKRIKYKKLKKNEGISENSNRAIEMSTGDYLGLLDHDDILHPSALYEVMNAICNEDADLIYTDEATFTTEYNIITIHHKPDYAIDTLRSCNYICHFSIFSRKVTDTAGFFRSEFDGSQDHDLILRYTDAASNIVHIPRLLYFWRSHPNSVAADISTKLYAITAGKNAVKEHLAMHGISAQIESTKVCQTIYRAISDLVEIPLISIIIPNKDNVFLLEKCLSSIREKTTYTNYEIIIIENNSTENATFEYYQELKQFNNTLVVFWKGNGFNYSDINNFGIKYAKGKHFIFLNNDIEIITPKWIEEMLMYSQREDVGAVGAKLYFKDDTIQHAGILLKPEGVLGHIYYGLPRETIGYMGKLHFVQNLSAVTAACMMVKRSVFEEVGFFDTKLSVSYNDVDLCLKIRKAGYLIVWTPFVEAYHHESKTRGYYDTLEKQCMFKQEISIFMEKWEEELMKGDPYYNCNFSLNDCCYTIK